MTKITFTGHSKGGVEAAANAVAAGQNAVVFNPATVNLEAYHLFLQDYKGAMNAYIVEGEILNSIFGIISEPIDKKTMLLRPPSSIDLYNEGKKLKASINSHSMDSVISGMENMKKEEIK